MSMDYLKNVYKPQTGYSPRATKTSYGAMNNWLATSKNYQGQLPTVRSVRGPNFAPRRIHPSVSQLAAVDDTLPVHLRYSRNCGYDDFHKAFRNIGHQWPDLSYPNFGPARLRQGRLGGSWRHIKEVMQAVGNRGTFIDGCIATDDRFTSERVPGGDLIKPVVPDSRNATWIYGLQSKANEHMHRKPTFDVFTQREVEHTNWCIMR
ncbi:uncharacterized protein LOC121375854 [Gigantopelta aegis]|uniref:uncharacterized protein LOC121375854 n=1 Tax=Gigantopelta aegis TaxID=1735272 RepID=UPI001B8881F9|nr:uncharacterized protein LOC121375854 [Gigantopelta aegis]